MLSSFRVIMPLLVAVGMLCLPGCGRGTPQPAATVVDPEPLPPEADLSPTEAAKVLEARGRAGPPR